MADISKISVPIGGVQTVFDIKGSGGSGLPDEVITYQQFLAKTDQEQAAYTGYVTGWPGSGGGGGTVNYSTTEHIIGTWIDGKPLYEKTIDCGALPNATSKTISSGLSNVTIIDMRGIAIRSSDGASMPLPYTTQHATNQLEMFFDGNQNIFFASLYNWSSYSSTYVTLRYTKTTD